MAPSYSLSQDTVIIYRRGSYRLSVSEHASIKAPNALDKKQRSLRYQAACLSLVLPRLTSKMWSRLLALTPLLFRPVFSTPYAVTEYYQVLTVTEEEATTINYDNDFVYTRSPRLDTTTQYITPTATAVPSALTAQTSTDTYYDVTVVKLHLPTGAGKPIQTESGSSSTRLLVPVTYSKCTTYSSGTDYAIPPITKSPVIYLTPPVAAKMSVLSTFVSHEYKTYYTATSTYEVAVIDPAGLDPVDFASLSSVAQPFSCLTATATVDYRHACEVGSTARMEGRGCGELNPCCYDCLRLKWQCFGGRCTQKHVGETFQRCADGVDYYSGNVTEVDEKYTKALPKKTKGDWSGVSATEGNPNEPTETKTGVGETVRVSRWGLFWGTLLIAVGVSF